MSSMRNGKKAPGIRTQVILGFVVFTAMVVALLWFFQIGLLNTFYKVIKINEIRMLSNRVVEMLDEGAGVSDFVRISHDTNVSILVTSADGSNISMTPNVQGGILDGLSNRDCRRLFEQVQAAGGFVLQDNIGEEDSGAPFAQVSSGPDMICARTVHLGQKGDYLVMLSSSIIPVSSTVETLKVQLWCLTFTMLFMGFVLAMFIATRLSRPLERINHSAKQLAAGSYGIRFPEQGAREVAELAGTLNYASAELSRVEDLRRELLANVSHDLRTPLTMISGYAEIMRDLPGENTPENVQVIIDEAQRLTGLVNDMLDLSRLQAGVKRGVRMGLVRS